MGKENFLYIILTGVVIIFTCIGLISTFKSIVRKLKNRNKVKLYSFKLKLLSSYICPWLVFVMQIYFDFKESKMLYEIGYYNVKIETFFDFVITRDIYIKIAFLCWTIIGIVCLMYVILSLIFPSGIYEDGIIEIKGKFIPWSDIKKVDYRNTIMGYSKEVHIYTSEKNFETVYTKSHEIDKVLSLICQNINIDIYEVTTSFDTVN